MNVFVRIRVCVIYLEITVSTKAMDTRWDHPNMMIIEMQQPSVSRRIYDITVNIKCLPFFV